MIKRHLYDIYVYPENVIMLVWLMQILLYKHCLHYKMLRSRPALFIYKDNFKFHFVCIIKPDTRQTRFLSSFHKDRYYKLKLTLYIAHINQVYIENYASVGTLNLIF